MEKDERRKNRRKKKEEEIILRRGRKRKTGERRKNQSNRGNVLVTKRVAMALFEANNKKIDVSLRTCCVVLKQS